MNNRNNKHHYHHYLCNFIKEKNILLLLVNHFYRKTILNKIAKITTMIVFVYEIVFMQSCFVVEIIANVFSSVFWAVF